MHADIVGTDDETLLADDDGDVSYVELYTTDSTSNADAEWRGDTVTEAGGTTFTLPAFPDGAISLSSQLELTVKAIDPPGAGLEILFWLNANGGLGALPHDQAANGDPAILNAQDILDFSQTPHPYIPADGQYHHLVYDVELSVILNQGTHPFTWLATDFFPASLQIDIAGGNSNGARPLRFADGSTVDPSATGRTRVTQCAWTFDFLAPVLEPPPLRLRQNSRGNLGWPPLRPGRHGSMFPRLRVAQDGAK
jgi:hypothetical protein